jgi:hypothetical protein
MGTDLASGVGDATVVGVGVSMAARGRRSSCNFLEKWKDECYQTWCKL